MFTVLLSTTKNVETPKTVRTPENIHEELWWEEAHVAQLVDGNTFSQLFFKICYLFNSIPTYI